MYIVHIRMQQYVFYLHNCHLQELDCLLSRHVMSLHSAPTSATTSRASNQLVTSVTVRRNSNVRMYIRSYVCSLNNKPRVVTVYVVVHTVANSHM